LDLPAFTVLVRMRGEREPQVLGQPEVGSRHCRPSLDLGLALTAANGNAPLG
jgi:hypothetical protein